MVLYIFYISKCYFCFFNIYTFVKIYIQIYMPCVKSIRPLAKKLYKLHDGIWTLFPFKVGPSRLHTLRPTFLPLPKTFTESFFWNGAFGVSDLLSFLLSKMSSFQWHLQLWKQPVCSSCFEVAMSRVWRVGCWRRTWIPCFSKKVLIMCDEWSRAFRKLTTHKDHYFAIRITKLWQNLMQYYCSARLVILK